MTSNHVTQRRRRKRRIRPCCVIIKKRMGKDDNAAVFLWMLKYIQPNTGPQRVNTALGTKDPVRALP